MDKAERYSTGKVASMLGVSRRHISQLVTTGELRAFSITEPGKRPRYRVVRRDLERFIARRTVRAANPSVYAESFDTQDYLPEAM